MPFWGPIIGAAIGVIGGLKIQKRQEKVAREAEKRNQSYLEDSKANDLSKTVKAAEKAGINPLTAIRSGAGNYQSNRAIMPSMSGYQFAVQAMAQGAKSAISYAETYKERALDALLKATQLDAMRVDIALGMQRLNNVGAKAVTGAALSAGSNVKTVTSGKTTSEAVVPGTGKTLDEIFAEQPLDNRVMKTADGSYVNDTLTAGLYPLVTPAGYTVYVPWNPEDSDVGAIIGGTAQYGATKAYDAFKGFNFGNMLKRFDGMSDREFEIRRQLSRF